MIRGVPSALARACPEDTASNVVLLRSARVPRFTVVPPSRSHHLLSEALLLGIVALELHALVFFWFQRNADPPPPSPPAPIELTLVAPPPPPPTPPPPAVEPKPLPPVAVTPPPKSEPPKAKPKPKPKPAPKPKSAPAPAPAQAVVPLAPAPIATAPVPVAEPAPPAAPVQDAVAEAHSQDSFGNPKPEYPPIARRRGWEGKVLVKVHVLENGRAEEVQIAGTSGHDVLDHAALSTVATWRFVPATRGKTPFASWVTISVTFKLEN